MNVIMNDNMHKTTAQFDILANSLPDLGRLVERGFLWALKFEADDVLGTVVWAPQVNEQMGHPAVEQGTRFVCIETGKVVEPFAVPIGSCIFFRQVLST
jgi:D-hexose-6-phosphate mutarotase